MIPHWLITLAFVLALLCLFAVGIAIGILYWHSYAKDNYRNAIFLIDEGKHTREIKGSMLKECNKGVTYQYDDSKKTIQIPHSYGFNYKKHRRRIDIGADGRLFLPSGRNTLNQHKYDAIVQELTLGHIGADIVKSVKSSKPRFSILIIAIVCLIIGALAMNIFGRFMESQQSISASQSTQQTQQTTPIPAPVGESRK